MSKGTPLRVLVAPDSFKGTFSSVVVAQALADGQASVDLCPPGGAQTQQALARLMGVEPAHPLENATALLAQIDEAACIGCALCLPACPVDAIVGAKDYLHTVLEQECTGCELCIAPCPVDCIVMCPVAS